MYSIDFYLPSKQQFANACCGPVSFVATCLGYYDNVLNNLRHGLAGTSVTLVVSGASNISCTVLVVRLDLYLNGDNERLGVVKLNGSRNVDGLIWLFALTLVVEILMILSFNRNY